MTLFFFHFGFQTYQVAIEAIEKKTADMAGVVQLETPDIKKLQLLLQGSISTQARAHTAWLCGSLQLQYRQH